MNNGKKIIKKRNIQLKISNLRQLYLQLLYNMLQNPSHKYTFNKNL
jgi:hypothetical protein